MDLPLFQTVRELTRIESILQLALRVMVQGHMLRSMAVTGPSEADSSGLRSIPPGSGTSRAARRIGVQR